MLYKVVLVSAIKQCESAISIYMCVCVCVYTGKSSGRETELPSDHNKKQKTFSSFTFLHVNYYMGTEKAQNHRCPWLTMT